MRVIVRVRIRVCVRVCVRVHVRVHGGKGVDSRVWLRRNPEYYAREAWILICVNPIPSSSI